jgi:hypothetical protein
MPMAKAADRLDGPITYQIQIQGRLEESWSGWLDGISIRFEGGVTTLVGAIPDQAALRDILTRIWDLNLTLLSVTRGGAK